MVWRSTSSGSGISAIVVVDTGCPASRDGWALFAQPRCSTFPTPIPLGFGFTLIGVGGLLALNRTIDVDALAGGAAHRRGRRAPVPGRHPRRGPDALLDGLDHWFPLLDGTTVVGPVVLIGWGSPTLITAQLGVIIALPDLVVTLLGSVEAAAADARRRRCSALRMDVLGAVDVPGGDGHRRRLAVRLEPARASSS